MASTPSLFDIPNRPQPARRRHAGTALPPRQRGPWASLERVFVVALVSLGTPAELEAEHLAQALGLTRFEARQRLAGTPPLILLRTKDAQRAKSLGAAMLSRGHQVVGLDLAQLPPADAQVRVRDFRLEPDALVSVAPNGAEQRLPWADVLGLVHAAHARSDQSVEVTRERKFSVGRAVMSQGLLVTKAVATERTTASTEREPVVYVFHRGAAPWLLTESHLRYAGLGSALRPTRLENFAALLQAVRTAAPGAPYDARLLEHRAALSKERADFRGQQRTSDNTETVDLLARVVLQVLLRGPRP